MDRTQQLIEQIERVGARNYAPLPVAITEARGVWAWDIEGRRYLDCLSAYSSLSLGHCHPRIVAALCEQAGRLALTSRAFHNDRLGPFLELLCELCGMEMALPMNTGAEAVETAIKLVRKWGYRVKGVPRDRARIIACRDNFHGRTTTLVGFSSEPSYRDDFGPYGPGFELVDFGDLGQLEAAIGAHTVAFLVEPIQAEAGIQMPPPGYLRAVRRLCTKHDVLLVLDEIQTGLGRTGRFLAHEHDGGVDPDVLVVGKALGGGVYPVSAVVASARLLGLIEPGEHGSTFGGNPLAAAVGRAALEIIRDEDLAARAARLGEHLLEHLSRLRSSAIREIRGRGLLIGIEIEPGGPSAREICMRLLELGVLTKDTHDRVIRLAPPLIVETRELDWLAAQLEKALAG